MFERDGLSSELGNLGLRWPRTGSPRTRRLEADPIRELEAAVESSQLPAEVTSFATALGTEWSNQRNGKPSPDEKTANLLRDYQATLQGARKRYAKHMATGRITPAAVTRAWMISRENQMRFERGSPGVKPLGKFEAPTGTQLVSHPLIVVDPKDPAPVTPLVVSFAVDLKRRYPSWHELKNYPGHGGQGFRGRGFSVDMYIKGQDARGFFPKDDSVRFLHAVHDAATAVGAQWRVIYNDFEVADAVNRALGRRHVVFVGYPLARGNTVANLIWHGPAPLILHFHLDLAPLRAGDQPSTWSGAAAPALAPPLPIASGSTVQPVPARADGAPEPRWLSAIPDAIRKASGGLELIAALVAGERDERALTNILFYSRHPELPRGYKIKSSQRVLVSEWLEIRDRAIQPVLAILKRAAGIQPTQTATAAPSAAMPPTGLPRIVPVGKGFKSSGGGRLELALRRLRGAGTLSISDADIETLQRVSEVETSGLLATVQTYDSAYLSFGFMQYTILHGELQALIRRAAAAFARHGIALEGTYTFKGGSKPGIRGASRAEELRSRGWVERFMRAALDDDIVIAQVGKALEEIAGLMKRVERAFGSKWSPAFASARVRALIAETHNNRPVVLWGNTKRGIRGAIAMVVPRLPAGAEEAELVRLLVEEIKRVYAQRNELDKALRLTSKVLRETGKVA